MAKFLTIEYAGTEKSVADWGIALDGFIGEFWNQRADTLSVRIPGANIADDPIFAFEEQIVFRLNRESADGTPDSFSNGSIEFVGKRVSNPLDLRPAYEGVSYIFHGPWYDLEHTPFRQQTAGWITDHVGLQYMTEVVLFMKYAAGGTAYVPATSGETITEILQSLLDAYTANSEAAPYQIGTIDPALNLPSFICKTMMCAEALMKCVELSPDCKFYFDYTTTPPTIHCRSQANLTGLNLALKDGTNHKSLRLLARPDLQARSVIINYEITTTVDGVAYSALSVDKYPGGGPDAGRRVVIESINLQGPRLRTLKGTINCAPVASNTGTTAARRAWWARHEKTLADTRMRLQDVASAATSIGNATFTEITIDPDTGVETETAFTDLASYPNELVDGTIHPWMGFNCKRIKVTVPITCAEYDVTATAGAETATNGVLLRRHLKKELHTEITVTDAPVGENTYSETIEDDPGEGVPSGMAQAIYTSLATLQYEGDYIKVEDAVTAGVTHAKKINLTGGRAEWTTMNAQLQSIRKDYGRGETEVSVGPAKHLNAGQIYSLLRFLRFRQPWYSVQVRLTGASTGGSSEITRNVPKKNTMPGLEESNYLNIVKRPDADPTGTPTGEVRADAKKVEDILAGGVTTVSDDPKVVDPKETAFCDLTTGEIFYQVILAGGAYTK